MSLQHAHGDQKKHTLNGQLLIENREMEEHQTAQKACEKIDIEALAARIRSAQPPPKKLTRRDAIEALKPTLQAALATGHTPASLTELLMQAGLKVGVRTLTSWMGAPRRGAVKKPPREQRVRDGGECKTTQ